MSRMATNEYIGAKRRAYAQANRAKRTRILDEVCETTGYERKYANRLLTRNREFREHKGRGKTYGDDVAAVLKKVWREAGCPCLPYFKAEVERWVEEYATQVAHISPDIRAKIVAVSDRTMSRLLSGEVRVKPGWSRGNKRSGRGARNEVKANTPCASGEAVMACNVPPGDTQIDTLALGGGDPSGNFFWILDGTDRKTQWTVLSPTWNRGQHATVVGAAALRRGQVRLPLSAGRARQTLRRLVGLPKLLLPVQKAYLRVSILPWPFPGPPSRCLTRTDGDLKNKSTAAYISGWLFFSAST